MENQEILSTSPIDPEVLRNTNAHVRSSESWRVISLQHSKLLRVPPLVAGTSQGSQTDVVFTKQLDGDNEKLDDDLQLLAQARPTAGHTDELDQTDDDH
ncbi:hypothetical protein AHF37_12527 [Paragonimus kellicotti]|nr:hypothetical protein AHF37_12527 [Paragonimus kellicotti]